MGQDGDIQQMASLVLCGIAGNPGQTTWTQVIWCRTGQYMLLSAYGYEGL